MGFILDGLETESYDRTYSDRELLRRGAAFFRPHLSKLGLISLSILLNSLAGAAGPVIIARGMDLYAPRTDVLLLLAAAVTGFGLMGWLFNYFHLRYAAQIIGDVTLAVRSAVFSRVVDNDLSFFDVHSSGKIVSRVASDTQDFSNVVNLVADLAGQFLLIAILSVYLFSINPALTGLLFLMSPLAFAIALGFRRLARRVSMNAKKVVAEINAHIQESVSGIMVAKTFRREALLHRAFVADNARAYRVGLRRGIVLNIIFPLVGIAAGFGNAALAAAGGAAVGTGSLSPGQWYLFMQAVGFFWWPLLNIASFWSQFQDGLAAAERVFSLLDSRSAIENGTLVLPRDLRARIEFQNVHFSYSSRERVLEGFSLNIEAGETLAVVGHTGAGKSSLIRLIARFYEFQGGRILIDGRDIRELDLASHRERIGYVPQDPFLFSGTVADNIRYGRPRASDSEVARAVMGLGRGDWLFDLPEGLSTDVGPRGSRISFGQRQLVALARVFLKDPGLFLLDEATSSVDPFTEARIQEGLDSIMRGRTAVVVAHRLSTVRSARRIIVLDGGRIVEEGSHAELLHRGGSYAELYNSYFRHQSAEYIEEAGSSGR